MRITMVLGTDYLHPVLDGRVAREAAALHSAGHQVTVICWARSASGELVDGPVEEVVNNVQIHRVFSPVSTSVTVQDSALLSCTCISLSFNENVTSEV